MIHALLQGGARTLDRAEALRSGAFGETTSLLGDPAGRMPRHRLTDAERTFVILVPLRKLAAEEVADHTTDDESRSEPHAGSLVQSERVGRLPHVRSGVAQLAERRTVNP